MSYDNCFFISKATILFISGGEENMKSMKVTVLRATKPLHLTMGQKVILVHDPESRGIKYDPKVLSVFDENKNEELGNVGKRYGATVISGTDNNEKLFDEMVKRNLQDDKGYMEISGVVVGDGRVTFKDGSPHQGYVIEVELPDIPAMTNTITFELVIRGSVKEYKGKTKVLRELQQGNNVQLWLKKDGEKLITFLPDGDKEVKAGMVAKAEKGDLDQLTAYLEALGKRGTSQLVHPLAATGNVYSVKFDVDHQTFADVLSGKVIRTLDEVRQGVLDQGIVEKDVLQDIEKYLEANKVSQKHIKGIFETMRPYPDLIRDRIPRQPKRKFKDTVGLVKKCIVYLNKGKHLRFIGEKGTGKNVMIETLAWIYQRPLYEMALNSQTDKMDILGSKTFESTVDENGKEKTKMGFDKEILVESLEMGGFMNLDEINSADPSVLFLLHPIADDRGRIQVPGYGLVQADKNFGLILSMNQDYIGTSSLNEATRDRFVPILFPDVPSIAKILAECVPNANPNDISLADRVYGSIRKLIQDGQLTNDCMTNRGFIDALEVSEDLGLQEALLDNVANRIEDEEYRNTVASIIDDIVG